MSIQIDDRKYGSLIALDKWRVLVGRSPATVWRWRKAGWLKTVNIAGKQYITAESLADFTARAERGDFARSVRPGCRANVEVAP